MGMPVACLVGYIGVVNQDVLWLEVVIPHLLLLPRNVPLQCLRRFYKAEQQIP